MNSKDRIDIIENNMNIKNMQIGQELTVLLEIIPSSADFDLREGIMMKEYFEPEDIREKESCINQVNNFINNLTIDYRDFITLIYT
ncbi:MAG: hypothetical protein ACI8WT_003112 [Clostridium sp.]|jgi:hypothetical protein